MTALLKAFREEREAEFERDVSKILSDLVWSVSDGGYKIEPKRFLSYCEEPVYEFEVLKSYVHSREEALIKRIVEEVEKMHEYRTPDPEEPPLVSKDDFKSLLQ